VFRLCPLPRGYTALAQDVSRKKERKKERERERERQCRGGAPDQRVGDDDVAVGSKQTVRAQGALQHGHHGEVVCVEKVLECLARRRRHSGRVVVVAGARFVVDARHEFVVIDTPLTVR